MKLSDFYVCLLIFLANPSFAQGITPDIYESDNSWDKAHIIFLDDHKPNSQIPGYDKKQLHNFHNKSDEDWVKFYALQGKLYNVIVKSSDLNCIRIDVYADNGNIPVAEADKAIPGQDLIAEWICDNDGMYYARISQQNPEICQGKEYALIINEPTGPLNGLLKCRVIPSNIAVSLITSYNNKKFQEIPKNFDDYFFTPHPEGVYTLTATADGYQSFSQQITILPSEPTQVDIFLKSSDSYIHVEDDLAMNFCASYQDMIYGVTMNFFPNPYDTGGIYWKLNLKSIQILNSSENCLSLKNDLFLDINAVYQGNKYGFMLNFFPNSRDPEGLYWKMDVNTFTNIR